MASTRQQRLARQERLRKIEHRKGIVAARSATQPRELQIKFGESRYQDNAAAAGVRNLNSQNDIAKIDAYLSSIGKPAAPPNSPTAEPPLPTPEPTPDAEPTPEPDIEPAPDPEMPDFDKMLSDLSNSFATQMQANEDNYMAMLMGLQDSLKSSQNPLMRNPVLGVRFAGQNNNASGGQSLFSRYEPRIQGIMSNQLNI